MNKILTAFVSMNSPEGERITYTYSEVDEKGSTISQNNKGSFILFDQSIQKKINDIKSYLNEKINSEGE